VAVLALGAGGLLAGLAQLHDQGVWVVAHHAVEGDVFALEQLFVLFVVLNKAVLGVHSLYRATDVAPTAQLSVTVYGHPNSARVRDVQAAGAVAASHLTPGSAQVPTTPAGRPGSLPCYNRLYGRNRIGFQARRA
jgi:hypothetical protein